MLQFQALFAGVLPTDHQITRGIAALPINYIESDGGLGYCERIIKAWCECGAGLCEVVFSGEHGTLTSLDCLNINCWRYGD